MVKKMALWCSILLIAGQVLAQNIPVTVVDEDGNILTGVSVYAVDQSFSVYTDEYGIAQIPRNLGANIFINFSYVGYASTAHNTPALSEMNWVVQLKPNMETLGLVEVVGRRADPRNTIPGEIKQITAAEFQVTNPATSADILEQHAGVFVQRSQMGGGSPILRGFEANRVLLVVDGIRLNNAIYRNGHLQNSITVDGNALEEVEVLYGPGALIYGSDALGGVIHYQTKDPKLTKEGADTRVDGHFQARVASANFEKTFNFGLEVAGHKWGSYTLASFSDFDDLWAGINRPEEYPEFGNRPYYADRINGRDTVLANTVDGIFQNNDPNALQRGTGYSQYNILQKVKFQPNKNLTFTANLQYSNSSLIPRYDNLTDTLDSATELRYAEWNYGPQERMLAALKTEYVNSTALFDRFQLIASGQRVSEERIRRRFGRATRATNSEQVGLIGLTADFDKYIGSEQRHLISYGLDGTFNQVNSSATVTNIETGEENPGDLTRYPSEGSQYALWGLYATYRYTTDESRLVFQAGGRLAGAYLNARFGKDEIIDWPTAYEEPGLSANNTAFSGSLSLILNTEKAFQFKVLGATAFRSPNIDDFAKIRENDGFITIPNPDLAPEQTFSGELGLAKSFGDLDDLGLRLDLTGYYTYLKDAIVRSVFPLPDGTFTLPFEGEALTTIANINAQSGFIYGGTGGMQVGISPDFRLSSEITYTNGRTRFEKDFEDGSKIDTLVPIAHIPPIYGRTKLNYKGYKFNLTLVWAYQLAKQATDYAVIDIIKDDNGVNQLIREGSSDNIEEGLAEVNEDGTVEYLGVYGWNTLNFYTTWTPIQALQVTFGVENILDNHYRTFSSGVSAPGLNFLLSAKVIF